jgi:hypothetical protein
MCQDASRKFFFTKVNVYVIFELTINYYYEQRSNSESGIWIKHMRNAAGDIMFTTNTWKNDVGGGVHWILT